MQRLWPCLGVVAIAVTGCSSSPSSTATPPPSSATARLQFTTDPPMTSIDGFPAPATFAEACRLEASVCDPNTLTDTGLLPTALDRPLKLPTLQPGEACPVTHSAAVGILDSFLIPRPGPGPVYPDGAVGIQGVAVLVPGGSVNGWANFKTLWFSEPSYQGPWVIRGKQLDGSSPVIFGEAPTVSKLVVPGEATVNETNDGYREAPGGTYLRGPGCYAWQVDGLSFSYVIVFKVVAG